MGAKNFKQHRKDKREFVYSLKEFEEAKTHEAFMECCSKRISLQGKDAWLYENVLGKENS